MGDGIGFDPCWRFPILNSWGKNVIIFNGLSVHIDNKKYILVLGKGPKQGLDDTTIIAEIEYSINLSRSHKKICLSLHYNGSNSFLFVNPPKYINSKQNTLK